MKHSKDVCANFSSSDVESFLGKHLPPAQVELIKELKEGIKTFWKKLTPEVCTQYINQLQVMPVVVAKQGAPLGH